MRLQQVVQPGGPGSFFKGDLQLSTQPVDKVQNDVRFGLDHAFHHDLSSIVTNRNRNTFLVHIHADIFSASHKGCSFLEELSSTLKTYSKRGRPFILRRVIGQVLYKGMSRDISLRRLGAQSKTLFADLPLRILRGVP